MASLEGGLGAVATASGQAAEFLTFAALAGAGDHIVSSARLYGGTRTLLDVTLRRFGVDTTFVAGADPDDFAAAIAPTHQGALRRGDRQPVGRGRRPRRAGRRRPRPRHPAGRRRHAGHAVPVPADRARRRHRRPLGDEVPRRPRHLDRRRRRRVRPLRLGRRPLPAHDRAGAVVRRPVVVGQLRRVRLPAPGCAPSSCATSAPSLSPFNAFLLLHGLETLPLRMEVHVANARGRRRLPGGAPDGGVGPLRRPAASPWRARAERYLPEGPGAVFAFGREGRPGGRRHLHRGASSWAATSPTSATPARSSSTRPRPPTPSSTTRASWRPA